MAKSGYAGPPLAARGKGDDGAGAGGEDGAGAGGDGGDSWRRRLSEYGGPLVQRFFSAGIVRAAWQAREARRRRRGRVAARRVEWGREGRGAPSRERRETIWREPLCALPVRREPGIVFGGNRYYRGER